MTHINIACIDVIRSIHTREEAEFDSCAVIWNMSYTTVKFRV